MIIVDLDEIDIDAAPDDAGTLKSSGTFPVHQTGEEVVYLVHCSRSRMEELLRRLQADPADGGNE